RQHVSFCGQDFRIREYTADNLRHFIAEGRLDLRSVFWSVVRRGEERRVIFLRRHRERRSDTIAQAFFPADALEQTRVDALADDVIRQDRKSTRLNSSHLGISY